MHTCTYTCVSVYRKVLHSSGTLWYHHTSLPTMSASVLFYNLVLWERARPGQYQSSAVLVSITLLSSVLLCRNLEWLG